MLAGNADAVVTAFLILKPRSADCATHEITRREQSLKWNSDLGMPCGSATLPVKHDLGHAKTEQFPSNASFRSLQRINDAWRRDARVVAALRVLHVSSLKVLDGEGLQT